jgi:hypothetical protein
MTARQPSNRQESGKKSIPPHRSHRFSGTFSAYKEEHKKKDGIKTRKAIPKLEIRTGLTNCDHYHPRSVWYHGYSLDFPATQSPAKPFC